MPGRMAPLRRRGYTNQIDERALPVPHVVAPATHVPAPVGAHHPAPRPGIHSTGTVGDRLLCGDLAVRQCERQEPRRPSASALTDSRARVWCIVLRFPPRSRSPDAHAVGGVAGLRRRAGQMEILQVGSDGRVQLKPRRPRYLRDEVP